MKKILIVGGGASGLAAGIWAAREGADVTILERNDKPGKKLCATGNGRCNFTNLHPAEDSYRGSHPDFVQKALSAFGPEEAVRFFDDLGVLCVSREGLMYPRSMQAGTISNALVDGFISSGGRMKTRERVHRVERTGKDGFLVYTDTWQYSAHCIILACGSAASAISGAGMDGYELAHSLGHHIVRPLPALTGLRCGGKGFASWAGVRTQADASLLIDGKIIKTVLGEVQLTDYGVSGIPVFDLSRYALRALEEGFRVELSLDFLPEIPGDEAEAFLNRRKALCPNKTVRELLSGWFPEKLARILSTRKDLLRALKDYRLDVAGGLSFEHAQACSGGVDTREVDPESMESELVPGLYLCGELLDIDGNCGGFNLQWAWASGRCAGIHAALDVNGTGGES